jgi:DNA-binding MarR family transcriptional regulator
MGPHTNDRDIRDVLDSIRRIVSALRVFDREAEAFLGISGAQLFILRQLDGARGISVNELADRTHTHQSSVSVVVDKLVHRGLVNRARSPKDARSVQLSLAAGGKRLLQTAPAAAQERIIAALRKMPAARRRQLARLLGALVATIGLGADPPALFFEHSAKSHQPPRRRRKKE